MEDKEPISKEVAEIIIRRAILEEATKSALKKAKFEIFKRVLWVFLKAFAWIGGGIFVTWLGQEGAKEAAKIHGSASYPVWWGAVLYGIIRLVLAFVTLIKSFTIYKEFKEDVETKKNEELIKILAKNSETDNKYETYDK